MGKSTLVRLFAEQQGLELLEVNLERGKLREAQVEAPALDRILDEIQIRTKKRITKQSLIFLDEIQEQPNLIQLLRYFYEEHPEIPVLCAGSLLEIALRTENFSFPVGRVEFQHLGPMTFTEFLIASGNDLLADRILAGELSPSMTAAARREFRNYLCVGGMPEAVKTFLAEGSLVGVREVQEQILQTYVADFPKYNSRVNYDRVQRVFSSAAAQVGKKVVFQRLDTESKARDVRRVLDLLIDARVILPCFHTSANGVPLMGEVDSSIQKIYFLDVGLLTCLLRMDFDLIDGEMRTQFNVKGILAEQFVAQHLAYLDRSISGPQLFYWLRDKGSQKAEIDFVVEAGAVVLPIEVKSRAAGHLKSLFFFIKEKGKRAAVKMALEEFSVQTVNHRIGNQDVPCDLMTLPIWAVESVLKLTKVK